MEVTGLPHAIKEQIMKLASINLCPNLSGQICCALMMNPPMEGEPSYELYAQVSLFQDQNEPLLRLIGVHISCQEKNDTLSSLKRRAELLVHGLNQLEGVTCNAAEGALYAFPRITLPPRAIEEGKKIGKDFLDLSSNNISFSFHNIYYPQPYPHLQAKAQIGFTAGIFFKTVELLLCQGQVLVKQMARSTSEQHFCHPRRT
jgi:hypothetical protein